MPLLWLLSASSATPRGVFSPSLPGAVGAAAVLHVDGCDGAVICS